ncbi:MAG: WD40 repeat domain-containing serine/threonine protein kinase [Phycisphaerales bacterium]
MTPAQYAKMHDILGMVDDTGPTNLEAFLRAHCDGDPELERSVRSMLVLRSRHTAAGLLGDDGIDAARRQKDAALRGRTTQAGAPRTGPSPTAIGRYRVIREIGSGGMGVVYECEQDTPKRRVAVKVVDSLRFAGTLELRLRAESEIQGRLHHPAIAQVYDAGVAPVGRSTRPFIAMELVRGRPLHAFVVERSMPQRDTLALVARVADGVAHAHSLGIVHRDLKPENVLVTDSGDPKIVDFGIARIVDGATMAMSTITQQGHVLGTLAYMAPEQLGGAERSVGPPADVFALGALAYELLLGHPPLRLDGKSVASAFRAIEREEPLPPRRLDPRIDPDAETIILKCLERDPDRRYPHAGELADDLRRYLASRPVLARRPSVAYRVRKFTARNRALTIGIASTLGVLIAGVVVAVLLANQQHTQRLRADRNALAARQSEARVISTVMHAAVGSFEAGDLWDAYRQHQSVPEHARGWGWRMMSRAMPRVLHEFASPSKPRQTISQWTFFDDAHLMVIEPGQPGLLIRGIDDPSDEQRLYTGLQILDIGHATRTGLVPAWTEHEMLLLDVPNASVKISIPCDGEKSDGSVSDDGTVLAVRADDVCRVWVGGIERLSAEVPPDLPFDAPSCLVSPNGETVVLNGGASVRIVDLATGTETVHRAREPFDQITGHPFAGGWVSHEWHHTDLKRHSVQRQEGMSLGPVVSPVSMHVGTRLAVTPDGGHAAAPSPGGSLLFSFTDVAPADRTRFANDEGRFIGADMYNTLARLSPTGQRMMVLSHSMPPWLVDLSADGASPPDPDPRFREYRSPALLLYQMALSHTGALGAAVAPMDDRVYIWDTQTLETVLEIPRRPVDYVSQDALVAFTPDDRFLVFTSPMDGRDDVAVVRADLATGETELFWPEVPVTGGNHAPLLDLFLATARPNPGQVLGVKTQMLGTDAVTLWRDYRNDFSPPNFDESASGQRWRVLPQPGRGQYFDARALSMHPSGSRVAVVGPDTVSPGAPSLDGALVLRSLAGELIEEIRLPGSPMCAAYSPDGRALAIGLRNGRVLILETEFYTIQLNYRAHPSYISALAWSADGHRLFTAAGDGTVRIWDDRPLIDDSGN